MDFDIQNLESILELAGDTGTAVGRLAKGVDAVKAVFKSPERASNADVKSLLGELTLQVADAKVANSELKMKLVALQEEVMKLQAVHCDLTRYELWETPSGSIVYRLKNAEQSEGEPMHYLCPQCAEEKKKSILQGHPEHRKCRSCKTGFAFEKTEGSTVIYSARRTRSDGVW